MSDGQSQNQTDRDEFWFECRYCDESWRVDSPDDVRAPATRHLNREHGDQLQKHLDAFDTVQRDGFKVTGNRYNVERYRRYLTVFDIDDPADSRYTVASSAESICRRCAARVLVDNNLEKVEEEPDSTYNDTWICSECTREQKIAERAESNHSLEGWSA